MVHSSLEGALIKLMLSEFVIVEIIDHNIVHHVSLVSARGLTPTASKHINSASVVEREMTLPF